MDDGTCRISVRYAWKRPPMSEESAEAQDQIKSMGLRNPPVFMRDSYDEETSDQNVKRWLTEGKEPAKPS
jgi:hypothetical protein